MKKTSANGQFYRFFTPLIKVMKNNGGSGAPSRLTDLVIEECKISEKEASEATSNGESRIRNQIAWARFYLVKAGYIDGVSRGKWSLTKMALELDLGKLDVAGVVKSAKEKLKSEKSEQVGEEDEETDVDDSIAEEKHKTVVLDLVKNLSPNGFEKFVKRVLTECGFESVVVTGKSGDGGIDGHGILKINKLTSMKVIFQCKRYKDAVGSSPIRDFRGAMAGRTDKGIVLTTGYFTGEAKKEATRDGVVPIELVDGEMLVGLMEQYGLGLIEKKIYDIDSKFFELFADSEKK